MAIDSRGALLAELVNRFGPLLKLPQSQSLFEIAGGKARVYVRYSKLHGGWETFFGLRRDDLRRLEGHDSFICFVWDGQVDPLFLPYGEYEEVFAQIEPASDGQYKVQIFPRDDATVLYVARAGRFNVDSHYGWLNLEDSLSDFEPRPALTHSQVQTLLGAIGTVKNFDVWVPPNNRANLDWSLTGRFDLLEILPPGFESVHSILQEIDVVWVKRGSSGLSAVYEVEYSTPIYSGLLRLNDVRLVNPQIDRLTVVSGELRRSAFVRQLNRPTFQASSLSSICTFLEYSDVYDWHRRLVRDEAGRGTIAPVTRR